MLESVQDKIAGELCGMSIIYAHTHGICASCHQPIRHTSCDQGEGSIYSRAGEKEYRISALCEHCFDVSIAEGEDDE